MVTNTNTNANTNMYLLLSLLLLMIMMMLMLELLFCIYICISKMPIATSYSIRSKIKVGNKGFARPSVGETSDKSCEAAKSSQS